MTSGSIAGRRLVTIWCMGLLAVCALMVLTFDTILAPIALVAAAVIYSLARSSKTS